MKKKLYIQIETPPLQPKFELSLLKKKQEKKRKPTNYPN